MNAVELATISFIAIGLAMDCFAVSVARGIATPRNRLGNALAIASSFGIFQAVMPLIGWGVGMRLMGYISGIDHWIAFTLLALVGLKMIRESSMKEKNEANPLTISLLILLSVATSIDAFAIGLSIALLGIDVIGAAIMIGVTSFILSMAGFFIGCKAGILCRNTAEKIGGAILIAIGLEILMEHMTT